MFALSQFNVVAAFTPSALPDFFAIPASIPDRGPLPGFLFGSLWHTRCDSIPHQEPSDPPGSSSVSMCCSMPSATPGRGIDRSSLARSLLLPASAAKASAFPTSGLSGLSTGFSFYRFTSQPSSAPCFGFGWSDSDLSPWASHPHDKEPFPGSTAASPPYPGGEFGLTFCSHDIPADDRPHWSLSSVPGGSTFRMPSVACLKSLADNAAR